MIANLIKSIRRDLGYSQAAFSKLIGCPKKSLCNWEQGIRTPRAEVMMRILEVQQKMGRSS